MLVSRVGASIRRYLLDPHGVSAAIVPDCSPKGQIERLRTSSFHTATQLCGKNLLRKFAAKARKKLWYESPTVGSKLMHKPSSLEKVMKWGVSSPQKSSREESLQMRTLNTILYRAIWDLLNSHDVSPQICDLGIEISKVSLTSDFSCCRVYWKISGLENKDQEIEDALKKSAPRIRHLLLTRQVLREVPPIVFIKDKEYAAMLEVEKLLENADFGPKDDTDDCEQIVNSERESPPRPEQPKKNKPSKSFNVFDTDHETLKRQVLDYKKWSKGKSPELNGLTLIEQQNNLLADLRKQKRDKKKKSKSGYKDDNDISPQEYLFQKSSKEFLHEGNVHVPDQTDELEIHNMLEEEQKNK
ncbi:putative ribosome-binding factor A, mitochondrial [Polypterus senegalus]